MLATSDETFASGAKNIDEKPTDSITINIVSVYNKKGHKADFPLCLPEKVCDVIIYGAMI
jgi:hypothetical protein